MKRLYVIVTILLFCSNVFSQHPHSRGGNPLRLIMNSSLRDLPGSDKNSAILTLERYDIHTVGDLCSRHRSEIEAIRGLRNKMNNVDKILSDLGLTYGMTLYKDSTLVD